MFKNSHIYFIILFLFFASCKKESIHPEWDVNLLSPIAKTKLTLNQIVADSLLQVNSDSSISLVVTTQPLNMEFLPQIAQIYADLKPPKVVYWRKLIKKDFILICDVCVICGKYLFMNSLNRLSSY